MALYYVALAGLLLILLTHMGRVITRVHRIRRESLLHEDYLDTFLDVFIGSK